METVNEAEHEAFRKSLRALFERVAPEAEIRRLDDAEEFPGAIYQEMVQMGLCGLSFGEEYGGSAADEVSMCIAAEEVSRAGASLLYAWAPTVNFAAKGIARYGSQEQREQMLPAIAEGRLRFAMALTEPDSGSDLGSLRTKARPTGDSYVINGQKVFSTGSDTADLLLTLVRVEGSGEGKASMAILLIPRETPGVTVVPIHKLAGQATHSCEIFFADAVVPAAALLGEVGQGWRLVGSLLDAERIYVGAQALGIAQAALDKALAYAQTRTQFGKPIIEHQAVAHMIADMAIEIETARAMVFSAARQLEQGQPCGRQAAIAKVAGSRAGVRCAGLGMQVLGGYSYVVDYGMERFWRESKLYEIVGGTNEIQHNLIARDLVRHR